MSGRELTPAEVIADFLEREEDYKGAASLAGRIVQWLTDAGFSIVDAPGRFEQTCPQCGAGEQHWNAEERHRGQH